MRDILFRGKRKDNGEWVVGDYSKHKSGKVYIKTLGGSATSKFEVVPETVGEFIMLDSHGKRIFEKDIVHVCAGESYQGSWEHDETFAITDIRAAVQCGLFDCERIMLRGNIFDNPELINMQKEDFER